MEILKHLAKTASGSVIIYRMTSSEAAVFAAGLPSAFRDCYIDNGEINSALTRASAGGGTISRGEVISNTVPDNPSVMSGDFGEIFSYFLLKEAYASRSADGPKKWRWKIDRNRPLNKTDVVLFSVGNVSSPSDLIVAAESKSRATAGSAGQFVEAFKGAETDRASRLAKTLIWFKEKATRGGDTELLSKIKRFIYSLEDGNGPYEKNFMAVLVTDINFETDEINRLNTAVQDFGEIEAVVISIPNMKDFYEHLFAEVPTT